MSVTVNNLDRARIAWGEALPEWVRLLAKSCDRTNQREVAQRLGKSNGYVSRLINQNYAGSYTEAEKLVRAIFGAETVPCPAMSVDMPLRFCMKSRRRRTSPQNHMHHTFDRYCPSCVFNTDREEDL